MAGTSRVTASHTAVGNIQSTHQYNVTVKFEIAFDWGGWNNYGAAYNVTCDGQTQSGTATFSVSSGGGSWVWTTIATKTFTVTMPTSGQSKTINIGGSIPNSGVSPSSFSASGTYTLPAVTWQYTVSYNANGGSGAPSAQTKTHGTNLTLSSTVPTRSGYKFLGWSTSSSATSASYAAGATYTGNGNVTLYAVWQQVFVVDLNYQVDGTYYYSGEKGGTVDVYINGSLWSNDVRDFYNESIPKGSTWEIKDIKPDTGYHYVSSTTSGTVNAGTSIIINWAIDTYTISYNANGGSGAPSSQTKTYGQTLKLSSTVPTRSGYTFLGWSTSSVATSATYSAGGNYVNNSGATLYAVWTKSSFIQTIMARYQLPTGDFTDYSQVYATSLEQGDTCSWSSKETAEYKAASISYTVGTTSETKYVTVYRQQYTIKYNANGGIFPPKTQTFYYGCDLRLSDKRPTRSGYDFLGWSRKYNGDASYKMGDVYDSTDTSNPTLYAIWSKRKTNIYLYGVGLVEASEYIETDEVITPQFNKYGTVYANIFNEELLTNESFSLGLEFIAGELSEIYIEKVELTDESGNNLTDENGNILYMEEEV